MNNMKKIFTVIFIIFVSVFITPSQISAAVPVGYLDRADNQSVSGWVKDDDYNGPIFVHIYIDGSFAAGVSANTYRSDVGRHGFQWIPSATLSQGNHRVNVYALGVDTSGNLNAENPELIGSPKTINIIENTLFTETYFTQPSIDASHVDSSTVGSTAYPPGGTFLIREAQASNIIPVSWDVGQFTGFEPDAANPSLYQRSSNSNQGTSAIQIKDKTGGIWINSSSVPHSGGLYTITPAQWWWDSAGQPKPWINAENGLSFSFEAKIPTAVRSGGAEVYFSPCLLFTDSVSGKSIWYCVQTFDLRPAFSERIHFDGWSGGTNLPIVVSVMNTGTTFTHLGPDSSIFQQAPWNDFKYFEFRITSEEFRRAIVAVNVQYPPSVLSPDPINYSLVHFNLDPEVYDSPAGSVGKIGMAYRNIKIARYQKQGILPTSTPIPSSPTPIPPTNTPTPPFPTSILLPGDLNHDGKVDIQDYNQLVTDFGKTGSPGFLAADINKDGKVDIFDYNILVSNFGK